MRMINRQFDLKGTGRVTLEFFNNERHFCDKVREHMLAPTEPWCKVLPLGLFRDLGCLGGEGRPDVESVYEKTVDELEEGIKFAAKRPVYVHFRGSRKSRQRPADRVSGFYFLAAAGYVVVARDDRVRSAYFYTENSADPLATLFENGWRYIKLLKGPYFDHKTQEHVQHDVFEQFSPENWTTCPNPHPRPVAPAALPEGYRECLEGADHLAEEGEKDE